MSPEAATKTFYQTRAAQIAVQSLDRIADEQIIGLIVASAGVGKTQAINYWRRKRNRRHVFIEADVLTSCRPILNALAGALGVTGGVNMWSAKRQVDQALARDPVMVILGQADLLTVRSFELLRSIWDSVSELRGLDGDAGFPLALFGTPKIEQMLDRPDLETLQRRVMHRAMLPPLSLDELSKVLGKWGAACDDAGLEELHRLSRGSFGWLNVIVPIAQRLAARDGKIITAKVLHATRRHLVGLPEE